MALSVKAVDAAKAGSARREISDRDGLYLIVQPKPSGAKSWCFRYRHDGKPRKLTIGPYPMFGLMDARAAAKAAMEMVDVGRDPQAEKLEARAAATREVEVDETMLVRNVKASFIKRHPWRGEAWRIEAERILDKKVVPTLGEKRIDEIRRPDILALYDQLRDDGMNGGLVQVHAVVRKLFRWAVERGLTETSPCEHISKVASIQKRTRRLTEDELRWFWTATERIGHPFGPMYKLLCLTGARTSEVAESTWSEYDLDAAVWTLPASRTKNGETLIRPLSDQALAVLNGIPRIGRYVITSNGKTPSSGFSRAKTRLDREMLKEAEEPIPDWWVHDLRRTMSSWMAQAGIPLQVAEKALGHTSGSLSGVAGIYNVHQYQQEQRAALTAWGAHVVGLVEPRDGA